MHRSSAAMLGSDLPLGLHHDGAMLPSIPEHEIPADGRHKSKRKGGRRKTSSTSKQQSAPGLQPLHQDARYSHHSHPHSTSEQHFHHHYPIRIQPQPAFLADHYDYCPQGTQQHASATILDEIRSQGSSTCAVVIPRGRLMSGIAASPQYASSLSNAEAASVATNDADLMGGEQQQESEQDISSIKARAVRKGESASSGRSSNRQDRLPVPDPVPKHGSGGILSFCWHLKQDFVWNRRTCTLFLSAMALTAIIFGVLIYVTALEITQEEDSNDLIGTTTPAPLGTPTASPISGNVPGTNTVSPWAPTVVPNSPSLTPAPTPFSTPEGDYNDVMLDNAIRQATVDESSLSNPLSPQFRARRWMLETDLLRDDVVGQGTLRMIQRYICAVLYFSIFNETGDSEVSDNDNPLIRTDASECEWTGVECTPDATDDSSDVVIRISYIDCHNMTLAAMLATNSKISLELRSDASLPPELSHLSTLQEVCLKNCSILGSIPETWFDYDAGNEHWPVLYWLEISHNALTGVIPPGIFALPLLRYLYLDSNNLSGELIDPSAIGAHTVSTILEDVRVFGNGLTGPSFPDWLQGATSLKHWIAHNNNFTGSLPQDPNFQWPSIMNQLDLSYNTLNGTIPSGLFGLDALQYVYLDHNWLTGSLPSSGSVREGRNLTDVWLDDNLLSGPIPQGFAWTWSSLRSLYVQGNDLTGTLGPTLSELCPHHGSNLTDIRADCDSVTSALPEVQCTCCSHCST